MARQYLHPGDKNRRITIQQRTQSQAASGQMEDTWSDYLTVWAQVVEDQGSEDVEDAMRVARSEVLFRIDYRSAINPADYRIQYNGETYEIESIREMGYKRALEIKTYVDR